MSNDTPSLLEQLRQVRAASVSMAAVPVGVADPLGTTVGMSHVPSAAAFGDMELRMIEGASDDELREALHQARADPGCPEISAILDEIESRGLE